MAAAKENRGGAPSGNKNNIKNRPITECLLLALNDELELNGVKTKKMRALAERLVHEALNGDMQAIKEVIDRVEGKPALRVESDHTERVVFEEIRRIVVDADNQEAIGNPNGTGVPTAH